MDNPSSEFERRRMEAFYVSRQFICHWTRDKHGQYRSRSARTAWAAWQEARRQEETRTGACAGAWHIPEITCAVCGTSLKQCPECRVIAGHRSDCSAVVAAA